jgi:hypothetical protein
VKWCSNCRKSDHADIDCWSTCVLPFRLDPFSPFSSSGTDRTRWEIEFAMSIARRHYSTLQILSDDILPFGG